MKVSFLGLGVMGAPMAGHLSSAGLDVTVYNRTHAKAEDWATRNDGEAEADPAKAVADADIVLMCLGDDPDVDRNVVAPAAA